ncbi:RimJ/RimL family protein N-acetyltransferase [Weissella uvarum]|uniref:GNAT family N-acetyltransferase n=1 Tax=Weissella uvarum TaxID=1479233 RepID=UPI0019614295|nr:GNAT family N-acetyltransferase [Weissella uvarum]MBM7618008.1 RimJ/RimL family protein N-acetyltransferase [Weissella uvarum]MCM0596227.1 GNAT family N-acetyltransferase [Weissella uvarum]
MELGIRLATGADSGRILELLKRLSEESDTFCIAQDVAKVDELSQAQNIEMMQATRNNLMLVVADNQDHLYGIATAVELVDYPGMAEIGLAILADYQGYGLAQALLADLVDWGETYSQLTQLVLTVQVRNAVAYHIYEKFGFQELTDAQCQVLRPEETPYETVEMQLNLKKES